MNRTFWITAGHQVGSTPGLDPGAVAIHNGITYKEADLALELRELVSQKLRSKGFTVNNEGNATALAKVVQWFQKDVKPDDIILDIHWNAAAFNPNVKEQANGVECYVQVNANALEVGLAANLVSAVASFGFKKRAKTGVRSEAESQHKRLGILNNLGNAVLLEVCFITNWKDLELYLKNKEAIADAIVTQLASV